MKWARAHLFVAVAAIAVVGIGALLAPLLANEQPLWLKRGERHFPVPFLIRHAELAGVSNAEILVSLGSNDWAILPPIPHGATSQDLDHVLAPPSATHWFGTDAVGRDIAARILHGARNSLTIALSAVALFVALGSAIGLIAGYRGGRVDAVLLRIIDAVSAFPTFLLVLIVVGLATRATGPLLIATIAATQWTGVARMVRAESLRLREAEFVTAARALGASTGRILARHILPHAVTAIWAAAAFGIGRTILMESALSYLGFGIPPPAPSWGELIAQAYSSGIQAGAWWLAVFPGLALSGTVLAFHVLAEQTRQALDPQESTL